MQDEMRKDFDAVMQAMYKMSARKLESQKKIKQRHDIVFGGEGTKMTCEETQEIAKNGGYIVDVRNPVDYMSGGRIHNSVNVPVINLINWCRDHPKINTNTAILVYSNEGNSAQTALTDLESVGYKNVTNIGTHKWYNLCS